MLALSVDNSESITHSRATISENSLENWAIKTGDQNVAFFSARERAELDKGNVETGEFAPEQENSETEGRRVANDLASLLQRVAGTSVQEIDNLIIELQMLREKLQSEGARVQREILEYAALNQSALQSTQMISESLRNRPSTRH